MVAPLMLAVIGDRWHLVVVDQPTRQHKPATRAAAPFSQRRGSKSLYSGWVGIGKVRSLAMSWLQTIHPVTVVVIACGFLLGASLTLA